MFAKAKPNNQLSNLLCMIFVLFFVRSPFSRELNLKELLADFREANEILLKSKRKKILGVISLFAITQSSREERPEYRKTRRIRSR